MTPANAGRKYPAEVLTAEEVDDLLGAITGRGPLAVRNRALVAVLWGSGLRISEALDLHPRDVVTGGLRVRHGKGDKARIVGLHPRASVLLSAWLEKRATLGLNGRQPVFCSVASGSKGRAIDPSYVRRLLPKLALKAGIDKRVHAHGLRHTHASDLVAQRVALHLITGQLLHTATATTDTYLAKVAPAERLAALHAAWGSEEG